MIPKLVVAKGIIVITVAGLLISACKKMAIPICDGEWRICGCVEDVRWLRPTKPSLEQRIQLLHDPEWDYLESTYKAFQQLRNPNELYVACFDGKQPPASVGGQLVFYFHFMFICGDNDDCGISEESTLSQWLYALLSSEVDKLVVCEPAAITKKPGAKTDRIDAIELADLLRVERLSLVSGYDDLIQEIVCRPFFPQAGQILTTVAPNLATDPCSI